MNKVGCNHCHNFQGERIDPNCRNCKGTGKVNDPHEILCNLCGECMMSKDAMDFKLQQPYGLHNATVQGGYFSYHLLDLNAYTFSFCEQCLRQLFIQCKIKPHILTLNASTKEDNYDWNKDQEHYEYRVWKDTGYFHKAYLNGKCNIAKDCPNNAIYTILVSDTFTEQCSCEKHKVDYTYGNSKAVPFISDKLKAFI